MVIQIKQENHHILLSNRERCHMLSNKDARTKEDIMDFLISLHLVLEIGLNAFYRQVIFSELQKTIEQTKVADNLDKINFIDKTILFFYLPHFDFKWRIDEADRYHNAIGELRNFSEIRNKLLHGHMNGQIVYPVEGRTAMTRAFKLTSEEVMNSQIRRFAFIIEAIWFYFDCLKSPLSERWKEDIKKFYLDVDFLKQA